MSTISLEDAERMARRNAEQAFLGCLSALERQGRRVNASRNTGGFAPPLHGRHEASRSSGLREWAHGGLITGTWYYGLPRPAPFR